MSYDACISNRHGLNFLYSLMIDQRELLITVDVDFYVDDAQDSEAIMFLGILDDYELVQRVKGSHRGDHTLGVLMVKDSKYILNKF